MAELKSKFFHILVFHAHLYGDLREFLSLLDKYGKYFYIKHFKLTDNTVSHYHIYFESNVALEPITLKEFFKDFVCSKPMIDIARADKESYRLYMRDNGRYSEQDIVSTF